MNRRIGAVLIAAAMGAGLGACASTETAADAPQPAWFAEAEANAPSGSFPDLRDVPTEHLSNTDQRHWNAVAAEVLAAGAAMQANPRAQPGEPEDPNAFLEEARGDLQETRQSH